MPTNRVYRTQKVFEVTINNTTDAVLTNAAGESALDLSDIKNPQITLEWDIATFTGTSSNAFTLDVLTHNRQANKSLSSTDPGLTQADGSTAFKSTSITTAAKGAIGHSKIKADGSAATNLGRFVGIYFNATVGTITACTGKARLYVKGD